MPTANGKVRRLQRERKEGDGKGNVIPSSGWVSYPNLTAYEISTGKILNHKLCLRSVFLVHLLGLC